MITQIYKGPINFVLFIISSPSHLFFLSILVLTLILGGVFPSAIYIYPYLNSKPSYDNFDMIEESPISEFQGFVMAPKRVTPNEDVTFNYKIQFKNFSDQKIIINYEIDKDNPYVSFTDFEVLPIIDSIIVPGNSTIEREYDFLIHEESKPTNKVIFSFYGRY